MTESEGLTPRPLGPSDRDTEYYETAAAIQRAHPDWLVMWGLYTRQYIAFPMFSAPKGTIASGRNPDELLNRMRQIELQLSQRGPG
jgi:hypothetical protein